jgi:hypothetical protein
MTVTFLSSLKIEGARAALEHYCLPMIHQHVLHHLSQGMGMPAFSSWKPLFPYPLANRKTELLDA